MQIKDDDDHNDKGFKRIGSLNGIERNGDVKFEGYFELTVLSC